MKLTVKVAFALSVIISGVFSGWIDPDTDRNYYQTISAVDNRTYQLVFSDEFNVEGRRFDDGSDPRWTSIHKDDYTNFALHYYRYVSLQFSYIRSIEHLSFTIK
jgi:hypothetical protein